MRESIQSFQPSGFLFAQNLDEDSLPSLPIEFGIVNLLPGPQIQLAICNGNKYLMTDQQVL